MNAPSILPDGSRDDRMYVRVVDWKSEPAAVPGDDVDSFVRREGPEALGRLIENAKPYGDWIITQTARDLEGEEDIYVIAHAVKGLMEMAAKDPDPVVRAHYFRRIAGLAMVDEAVLTTPVSPEPIWTDGPARHPARVPENVTPIRKPRRLGGVSTDVTIA